MRNIASASSSITVSTVETSRMCHGTCTAGGASPCNMAPSGQSRTWHDGAAQCLACISLFKHVNGMYSAPHHAEKARWAMCRSLAVGLLSHVLASGARLRLNISTAKDPHTCHRQLPGPTSYTSLPSPFKHEQPTDRVAITSPLPACLPTHRLRLKHLLHLREHAVRGVQLVRPALQHQRGHHHGADVAGQGDLRQGRGGGGEEA